ncbi:hypothetical protein ME799_07410 [Lactobacillus delbrueckii]|nr:hypothetical protein ME799_07410 [Lactobacillus delbrueckii]
MVGHWSLLGSWSDGLDNFMLMLPELSVVRNAIALLWIIIMAYELTMLDQDSRQNERKHIVKIAILFALVIGTLFI